LEVIVKKALRKDRNERYQTIHDLLLESLKELKREIELAASLERSTPPASQHTGRWRRKSSPGSTLAPPACLRLPRQLRYRPQHPNVER
jgi:hypothetical protein